ncbi:MAG TPA: DsbA family protein [Hyphomicrobiaceae bacterium]|nr:DsbA family protein [Hyphomicrobiaceae bacterium]
MLRMDDDHAELPYFRQDLWYLDDCTGRMGPAHAERSQGTLDLTNKPSFAPLGRPMTRRDALLLSTGAVALSLAAAWGLSSSPAIAQRRRGPAEVPVAELMKPGPLPELEMGSADAPITVVEYASLSCPHCAHFHTTVFPDLKKKYVDTGKVRFVFREFPLNDEATAAAMLARCAGDGKTLPLTGVLFDKQDEWMAGDMRAGLFKIAQQAGFTKEAFEKCMSDNKLEKDILSIREHASKDFGVNATPTFFINGKRMTAAPVLAEFDKAFAPILKS